MSEESLISKDPYVVDLCTKINKAIWYKIFNNKTTSITQNKTLVKKKFSLKS